MKRIALWLFALLTASVLHAAEPDQSSAERLDAMKFRFADGATVRAPREDWSEARLLVQRSSEWKTWLEQSRKKLDAWIASSRERPEWVAGWTHDLVDPGTQKPLRWSPEMPEPAKDTTGGRLHGAWVASLREHNIRQVLEAARLARLTGEVRYAKWAIGQIDFYADNFARWPLRDRGGKARLMSQGLDDATAAVTLVQAVRLLREDSGEERRARWHVRLFGPIAENLKQSRHGIDNIRLWHMVACALIGMEFDDSALLEASIKGPRGVRNVIEQGMTADFFWREGSFGYQTYVLRALAPLLVEAGVRGRWGELSDLAKSGQNLLLAPLQLRFDDGTLPSPGDVTARQKAIDRALYLELYRAFPLPVGLVEAGSKRNWDTLLDPAILPRDYSARILPPVSRVFPDSGMAILRENGWQAFLLFGQLAPNHAQPEALSSEIYYEDIAVSTDAGTVRYGSDLHKQYFSQAIAQNTVLIDGQGQQKWGRGEIESFSTDPAHVKARFSNFRGNYDVLKYVELSGLTLHDKVEVVRTNGKAASRFGRLFHTDCEIEARDFFVPTSAPFVSLEPFWRGVRKRIYMADAASIPLRCQKSVFMMKVSASSEFSIYIALTPDASNSERYVLYAEVDGAAGWIGFDISPLR